MAKNFKTQLSGQIGEHLVVAELGRQGIIATPFAGNVPDIDLLIYANGKSESIQVKAIKKGTPGVNATNYLSIEFDGDVQKITGKKKIERSLIFVLVKIGDHYGEDEFYVFEQGVIQDLIFNGYSEYLKKHTGIRPRNPKTTHSSYFIDDLVSYKNKWELIKKRLEMD